MQRSELDHIVVASTRLEEGVAWVAQRLEAQPQPGGKHVAMGTHNALLKLGSRAYLEVIAIDPDGATPTRPRWFSLDETAMHSRLAAGPALITWVLRCDSLAAACARVPDLGEILSMSRGDFHWKIAVPDTGTMPWSGVLPAAIQWEPGADGKRVAGVTASGFGGINYHVIVEQSDSWEAPGPRTPIDRDVAVIAVSCRTPGSRSPEELIDHLMAGDDLFSELDADGLPAGVGVP